MKAYRHGENLLIKIEALPEDVQELKTNVFATGSSHNNHSITTGIACKNTNRNYILIEKEPEYVDIINKRLNN